MAPVAPATKTLMHYTSWLGAILLCRTRKRLAKPYPMVLRLLHAGCRGCHQGDRCHVSNAMIPMTVPVVSVTTSRAVVKMNQYRPPCAGTSST
jgi:hypothetical protein